MGCTSSHPQSTVCHSEEVASQDFFDKYKLGVKIGRGAFAQVRVAIKASTGPLRRPGSEDASKTERAVKILDLRDKDNQDETNPQLLKVAQKEASVWKNLGHHPNCIRLYDLFCSNEFCYMVMEKCSSGLLQALESMPDLTERGLGNVFAQMLLGISRCHSVGVIHRDIKPDNFLVGGEDGQVVKLGDFGLSSMIPKQGGKLPGVFGTAPFMAPEMLIGRLYDEKADIWSLAVIIYVFLFGVFPYMPKQQSSKAMKQAIIDGADTPSFEPIQRGGGESNSLFRSPAALQLVRTLLDRDPETRLSAAEALDSPLIVAALEGVHLAGEDLPSLRPMLHAAKKVGAFEVRDPARDGTADIMLNELQMKRHGETLPPSRSSARPISPDRALEREKAKAHEKAKRENCDTSSNHSTACDSDNGNGRSAGSHVGSSSSAPGVARHGSGWSKGDASSPISDFGYPTPRQ